MEKMLPNHACGRRRCILNGSITRHSPRKTFSFFALEVPGKYVFLGATPYGQDPATAPGNHSPYFNPDEAAMKVGTELFINWTLNFLAE